MDINQLFHLETDDGGFLYCKDLFDPIETTKKVDGTISKPTILKKMRKKIGES